MTQQAEPGWRRRPRVAAIVTEYRPRSHADVLITKLLEGYTLFWTPVRPRIEVVSLYTDQVPANDISREIAGRNRFGVIGHAPNRRGAAADQNDIQPLTSGIRML